MNITSASSAWVPMNVILTVAQIAGILVLQALIDEQSSHNLYGERLDDVSIWEMLDVFLLIGTFVLDKFWGFIPATILFGLYVLIRVFSMLCNGYKQFLLSAAPAAVIFIIILSAIIRWNDAPLIIEKEEQFIDKVVDVELGKYLYKVTILKKDGTYEMLELSTHNTTLYKSEENSLVMRVTTNRHKRWGAPDVLEKVWDNSIYFDLKEGDDTI